MKSDIEDEPLATEEIQVEDDVLSEKEEDHVMSEKEDEEPYKSDNEAVVDDEPIEYADEPLDDEPALSEKEDIASKSDDDLVEDDVVEDDVKEDTYADEELKAESEDDKDEPLSDGEKEAAVSNLSDVEKEEDFPEKHGDHISEGDLDDYQPADETEESAERVAELEDELRRTKKVGRTNQICS